MASRVVNLTPKHRWKVMDWCKPYVSHVSDYFWTSFFVFQAGYLICGFEPIQVGFWIEKMATWQHAYACMPMAVAFCDSGCLKNITLSRSFQVFLDKLCLKVLWHISVRLFVWARWEPHWNWTWPVMALWFLTPSIDIQGALRPTLAIVRTRLLAAAGIASCNGWVSNDPR